MIQPERGFTLWALLKFLTTLSVIQWPIQSQPSINTKSQETQETGRLRIHDLKMQEKNGVSFQRRKFLPSFLPSLCSDRCSFLFSGYWPKPGCFQTRGITLRNIFFSPDFISQGHRSSEVFLSSINPFAKKALNFLLSPGCFKEVQQLREGKSTTSWVIFHKGSQLWQWSHDLKISCTVPWLKSLGV